MTHESLRDSLEALPPSPLRDRWMKGCDQETEPEVQVHPHEQYVTRAEMDELRREMQAVRAYFDSTVIDFDIGARDAEIAALKEQNALIIRALGKYAISECGEVPDSALLTYLKCQIWYSPHLTKDEQKNKSIWSFRLSVEVAHHRLPEEINIRLFPISQFYYTAKKPHMRTPLIIQACEFLLDQKSDAWAGFVQGFTHKKGRPYVKEQAGFIVGHTNDTSSTPLVSPQVSFALAEKQHIFTPVRPANGDAGSSLWWCDWRPVTSQAASE
jgi:hypothetical protein